ncbi:MAG TPA: hypothetical protein VFA78_09070 [Chloroflexota bacterium]|nr:hypothetical protein [Chloroflexota bacterium]
MSDVFELEDEAARTADRIAGIAATASLRDLEKLIDDYETLQRNLEAAHDAWQTLLNERSRSSSA